MGHRILLVMLLVVTMFGSVSSGQGVGAQATTPVAGSTQTSHPLVGTWVVSLSLLEDPNRPPAMLTLNADGTALYLGVIAQGAGSWVPEGSGARVTCVFVYEDTDYVGTNTFRASIGIGDTGLLGGTFSFTAVSPDGMTVDYSTVGVITGTRIPAEPTNAVGTPLAAIPTWIPATDEASDESTTAMPTSTNMNDVGTPLAGTLIGDTTQSEVSLAGTAPDNLPSGEPGVVSVVLTGPPVDIYGFTYIPLVLRNNSGDAVHNILVNAVLHDGNGTAVLTLQTLSLEPKSVSAGGIVIGLLLLMDRMTGELVNDVPPGTSFEFSVELMQTEDINSLELGGDLTLSDIQLTGDGISGIATNPYQETMSLRTITGVCFDLKGAVLGAFYESPGLAVDLAANESTAFTGLFAYSGDEVTVEMNVSDACASYLVSATAVLAESAEQ